MTVLESYGKGPHSLHFSGGYYSSTKYEDQRRFNAFKSEIEHKLVNDIPIYVTFRDARRAGSIGRLVSVEMEEHKSANYSYYSVGGLTVKWDDRPNVVRPDANEIYYMPQYIDCGTTWAWNPPPPKEKKPAVVSRDHLGEIIEVGMFVSFIYRRHTNIKLQFGTVTRMSDAGTIWIKTLKLRDKDPAGQEVKAYSADSLTILNDNLMSRLMLARMAAN